MKRALLGSFILVSFFNLYSVSTQWQLGIYCTKPLLMLSLAVWFYLHTKDHLTVFAKCILAGLIISIAGDTFLMFSSKDPSFFLFGLGSFLITHIFYIAAFVRYEGIKEGLVMKKNWMFLPVFIYLIVFLWYLWPDLPKEYLVPVVVYGCVISTMLVSVVNMKGRVKEQVSVGLIIGALLFVISDSFIAVDKFKVEIIPSEYMGAFIMSTYLLGQFYIAKNSISANEGLK